MRLNPMEKKRLLQKRAKRLLEAAGYGLRKLQGGGLQVIDGNTEEVLATFDDIVQLGQCFRLWGFESVNEEQLEEIERTAATTGKWSMPSTHDRNGMLTPEHAAILERNDEDDADTGSLQGRMARQQTAFEL